MTVPVTVLSGTLGAGKTTLLNHVLTADHGYEAAVLVNDMGEVNVDADLVERRAEDESEVVELSNGCICCGIQGEFEQAITDLALNEEFEYLLVEPSGISEPAPIAQQFVQSHASTFYDLSSVTTVVDARQFHDAFSGDDVSRHGNDSTDARPLSDLIVEGVEFCDTIVVNKTDLVDPGELESVLESIRALQPEAEPVKTEFGRVDPNEVLATDRFDAETVSDSSGWKRALDHHREHDRDTDGASIHDHGHSDEAHEHAHSHPPEVYGIESFVYDRREPLHPERLIEALERLPGSVIRAKGYLHVAGRSDHALTLSRAGRRTRIEVAGRWIASLPTERQKIYRQSRQPDWDDEYGDRKTELVVIGRNMDDAAIERRLEACRLTDAEADAESLDCANPFPTREGDELQL